MNDEIHYEIQALKTFAADVLAKAGLKAWEAETVADSLVEADARGVGSHGLSRLRTYTKRVLTGVIDSNVVPQIVKDSRTALLVDGGNGIGASVGRQTMKLCVDRAKTEGSCFAAVRRANHFGIAACFTMQAAQQGMIGLAMSNAPASIVPTGGRRPMLGTNPLSIAVPAGKFPPLVLDMACSVVAQGKVILAAKEGRAEIPAGWAVDKNGQPTTDPQVAWEGAMLPFGGPKGYAIAFIIDIFCSALSGALSSTSVRSYWDEFEQPQGLGFFMGAWNVESFLPLQLFQQRMDDLLREMKACPPAPGFEEVLIPGEIEWRRSALARENGIALSAAVTKDLVDLGEECGVEFPLQPARRDTLALSPVKGT